MNTPVSISIDGNFITGRIEGLDQLSVTKRRKNEQGMGGAITSTFSSELTFYDDAYDYLKSKFIDPLLGFDNEVNVKIYDDECNGLIFEGKILGDAIDWCYPECSVKARVVEIDPVLSCVQSKLIDDNSRGFYNTSNVPTYKLGYCVIFRPEILYDLAILLGAVVADICYFIEIVLVPFIWAIAAIVWLLCQAVKILRPRTNCNNVQPGRVARNWLTEMNKIVQAMLPCQKYHPVTYMRNYIINACRICNLNFKSSILNDTTNPIGAIYYDSVLFSAPIKKGHYVGSGYVDLISENAPIETLETLFNNYLNPTFNGDWAIIGNDFIFERKDYFANLSQWIDTDVLLNEGRIEDGLICFSWTDKEKKAYGRFEYSLDAIEHAGNESKSAWGDIVEWNPTANPKRKGEHTIILPMSPAGVIWDKITKKMLFPSLLGGGTGTFEDGWIIMSQDNVMNYKLLLMDQNGLIKKYDDIFTGTATGLTNYNYPYWFREGVQGVSGFQNNLYSLFHYIDDPRNPNSLKHNFNFTFQYKCSEVSSFAFTKYVRLYVGNQHKNGVVEEVVIDYNKRTIKVSGKV